MCAVGSVAKAGGGGEGTWTYSKHPARCLCTNCCDVRNDTFLLYVEKLFLLGVVVFPLFAWHQIMF